MTETDSKFEGYAIVELMGHRRLAGFVTEQQIAGAAFLRLDIPGSGTPVTEGDGPEIALHGGFEGGTTQFYSPQAVYCITPTTEEIAVAIGKRSHPAPVQRYELEPPRSERETEDYDVDDVNPDLDEVF